MKRTIIQALALALSARARCDELKNDVAFQYHDERIEALMDGAPSGSGFDNGTELDADRTREGCIVFSTSFHHMDENGYYDGWTDHTIRVRPSFEGFDLTISGRNRRDIKDYIGDVFHEWLSGPAPDPSPFPGSGPSSGPSTDTGPSSGPSPAPALPQVEALAQVEALPQVEGMA